jgi:hypothetical protein
MAGEGELSGAPPAAEPSSSSVSGSLESRLTAADNAAGQPAVGTGAPAAQSGESAVTPPAAGAGQAGQAAQAAEWQGINDFARAQGIDLPWKDDVQALQNLISAYRQQGQRNFYADLGRQIAPHADQVRAYLLQQQQMAQQAQPTRPWAAPAFKREWLAQVETDPETGQLRAKPGYDPSLPEKVQAYADWRDKFLQAPDEVLKPWVAAEAQQIVQQQMATYQEQAQAQQLVQAEAQWMFQGGRVGAPLTAAGQMYGRAADQFFRAGLRDVRALHAASVAVVQNAFLRQQVRSAPAAQAAAGQTPAQRAAAPQSVASALGRAGTGGARPPAKQDTQPLMSLRERLMSKMNGVPE